MNGFDLIEIMPIVLPAAAAVIIMLVLAFRRSHALTLAIAAVGLAMAMASLALPSMGLRLWVGVSAQTPPAEPVLLLSMDGHTAFFAALILGQTLLIALLSYGYLQRRGGMIEEYYVLLLIAALGAVALAASTHFVSFFLGLEILSIALYPLIAYHRRGELGVEAGFKYLVLAATASAVLLFGMAMIYADLGTMQLARISELLPKRLASGGGQGVILMGGLAMIATGVAFKLALAPLHLWTPDVYQGAPAPVSAFIASVSKGAVFALLLRYFGRLDIHTPALAPLVVAFEVLAVGSMCVGNLLALMQTNVKRMLAYSSIAQLGYLMVAFLASGSMALTACAFYLLAYFVTIAAAFGVVAALSGRECDAETMDDFRGLAWRRGALAAVMTASLLSLAGIPLTAGFIGKFYLVAAGAESGLWMLVIMLLVNSAVSIYYYVRLIAAMYMREPEPTVPSESPPASFAAGAVHFTTALALAIFMLLLAWLGVYPSTFIRFIELMGTPLP